MATDTPEETGYSPTSRLIRFLDRISFWLAGLGGVLLFLIMLLTFADVAGRSFDSPIGGAKEATEVMLAILVFLLLPVVTWERRHIVIDLLDGLVPHWLRGPQRLAVDLLGAVACGYAVPAIARQARSAFEYGDRVAYIDLPMGWVVSGMTCLVALTALAFAGLALLEIARMLRRGPAR